MDKLVVTTAITGSVTLPTQTPYLPITPEQIAQEVKASYDAGSAVTHVHARNPETGQPSSNIELYRDIVSRIRKESDIVICITTGAGANMTRDERIAPIVELKPELSSLNMGSMNFSIHPLANKIKEWKFDWERKLVDLSKDYVFRNTFEDIEYFVKRIYDAGVKPELEVYDVGHLYTIAFFLRTNVLKPPVHMQFVMGILGGIGATPEDLVYLKTTADRLIGRDNYTWSVIGVGLPSEFNLAAMSITMGGHVRVGFEDNVYVAKNVLAKSNAELVAKVKQLTDLLGRPLATAEEARKILGLRSQ